MFCAGPGGQLDRFAMVRVWISLWVNSLVDSVLCNNAIMPIVFSSTGTSNVCLRFYSSRYVRNDFITLLVSGQTSLYVSRHLD